MVRVLGAPCSSPASIRSKRNVRPNPMKNEVGGIVTKEAAISAANVAIYNASTQRPMPWRSRSSMVASSACSSRPVKRSRRERTHGSSKEQYQRKSFPRWSNSSVTSLSCRCRLTKIVVNMGVGEGGWRQENSEHATKDLTAIVGQKPVITKGQESYRELQDSRRLSGRHHGDAAQQADVRDSSIVSSTSRCRACVTSAEYRRVVLTVAATSISV